MTITQQTQEIARQYFDAWATRDTAAAINVLAKDFEFTADDMKIEGREAFLSSGAYPSDVTTEMVAEAYQDDIAFQMYDATKGSSKVRIVEQLKIDNGKITSSTFVTDMAAFMALFAPAADRGGGQS